VPQEAEAKGSWEEEMKAEVRNKLEEPAGIEV
jgi:hypothetical protein